MKPIQVADDIIPIGEFKTHASRLLRQIRETGRPMVITQNGRPAGVVLTPEEFDRLTYADRLRAAVDDGLADVKAGRVLGDDELTEILEAEFDSLDP
jgi:prevent-host-death family protein